MRINIHVVRDHSELRSRNEFLDAAGFILSFPLRFTFVRTSRSSHRFSDLESWCAACRSLPFYLFLHALSCLQVLASALR